jgi:hypothetical protein
MLLYYCVVHTRLPYLTAHLSLYTYRFKVTPLHAALGAGKPEIVELLLVRSDVYQLTLHSMLYTNNRTQHDVTSGLTTHAMQHSHTV